MDDPRPDDPPRRGPGDVAAAFCATLVDEWVRGGVTDAVMSPGSRSTPIVMALDAHTGVRLHVLHDERCAAFTALGLAMGSGRPALLACTSGTAAVHFHAAVVEADLAAVPMLVLTADRPPELQGVLAPQTIDQRELYGSSVRWYCEPGPPEPGGSPWWRDLARDALSRATGALPGPVHLDLAFREPLLGDAGDLPAAGDRPPADRGGAGRRQASAGVPWGLTDEDVARLAPTLSARRGVVVAGARSALDDAESDALWELADHLGWPVIADGPSGVRVPRPGLVSTHDLLLRHEGFAADHVPEVVLRVGGLLTSRVTGEWLAGSGATQIAVDRFGRSPDPDRVLARSFAAVPADAAGALIAAAPGAVDPAWRRGWEDAERAARAAVDNAAGGGGGAPSEPVIAMDVAALVPDGGNLVVSSSMPVRDLEWFAAPRTRLRVHANRGANGIDGVTSTALGVAAGSGRSTVLLTGDVAFLHDVGALTSLRRWQVDLTVVVVDNDGGGIFSFLPQADRLPPLGFERLFGTPHGVDLAAVVRAFAIPVEVVASRPGLRAALAGAMARGGTRVVVVRTDRSENVAEHRRFQAAVAAALR